MFSKAPKTSAKTTSDQRESLAIKLMTGRTMGHWIKVPQKVVHASPVHAKPLPPKRS